MSNISKRIELILKEDEIKIKDKIYLYRSDYGIEFQFNIVDFKYMFDNNSFLDGYDKCKASVTFVKPDNEKFYIDTAIIADGLLTFLFTEEMTDELKEIGIYKIQFHIFNQDRSARMTLPHLTIEVKDLVGEDNQTPDDLPLVGSARVDYARLIEPHMNSIPMFKIENGIISKIYNPTNWVRGDLITAPLLNKIESALVDNSESIDVERQRIDTILSSGGTGGHIVSVTEPSNKAVLWVNPSDNDYSNIDSPLFIQEIKNLVKEFKLELTNQINKVREDLVNDISDINVRIDAIYEILDGGGTITSTTITTIDGNEITTISGDKIITRR